MLFWTRQYHAPGQATGRPAYARHTRNMRRPCAGRSTVADYRPNWMLWSDPRRASGHSIQFGQTIIDFFACA